MEYRSIEVKLLCAKDLKDVNVLSKMNVYVIGSVSGDPRSIQRTTVDKDGGINPKWNYDMQFTFDECAARMNRLGLVFQIMSDRTLGDKEVGRVYVPLKELFDVTSVGDENSSEPSNEERHMIYQVQTPTGKFKGQLEFTFKFGEKFMQNIERKLDEPVIAYPAMGSNPGVGSSTVTTMGSTSHASTLEPTIKSGPSPYPSLDVGGNTSYGQGASQPKYVPQNYGYGYGYGCGYGYTSHHMPPSPPNPYMGYGNGYSSGYGYAGQAPPGYVQQPVKQKHKKSKFGLGAAAGIGAGLLGGLLVGDMVGDMVGGLGEVAESVSYDGMLDSYDGIFDY